jgi:hypothetical protein
MKNPYEVLRLKEQEIIRVQQEVEALRIAARLLSGDEEEPAQEDSRRVAEMP